jgi:hypothetical protein
MNIDLENMWKELVMVYFKVLSWHLPVGTRMDTSLRISSLPAKLGTMKSHKYDVAMLITVPSYFVQYADQCLGNIVY